MAGVTFLTLLAAAGMRSTPSVLIVPLEQEFGWILAAHQLGAATAAFGAGALRTIFSDYQVSFITAGILCLVASGMVIRIGRKTHVNAEAVSSLEASVTSAV